jgi:hypothetical protein
MTLRVKKTQDIDDPTHIIYNLILQRQYLSRGYQVEQDYRKTAIKRYLKGEKSKSIYTLS